jgi:hypothetical protein
MKEKLKPIVIKIVDLALLPLSYIFLPVYKWVKNMVLVIFQIK